VLANLEELRALTADEAGAQRVAWSPTWLKARAWFEEKLRTVSRATGAELEAHYDAAGNHWVTLAGRVSGRCGGKSSGFGAERWVAGWVPGRDGGAGGVDACGGNAWRPAAGNREAGGLGR